MLAQIARIGTREFAESAFVWFLALMERADVGLQLRVGRRGVAAAVADVWSLASMSALVVVFRLIGRKCLVAAFIAAGVGTITRVTEQVSR
jgi:hypothetical protein